MKLDKTTIIQKLGISPKHGQIFLYLLQAGPSNIANIARENNFGRTSVYLIVKKLIKENLVAVRIIGKIKYYEGVDVENLVKLQEDRLRELIELKPLLKSISKIEKFKPKVEFFEGEDGIKKVYNDTLLSDGAIVGCTSVETASENIIKYSRGYIKKRIDKKIPTWGFIPDSEESRKYSKRDKQEMRVTKRIDPKKYPLTNEINIYNDKVAIISLKKKESFGLIITSKELANTLRSVFRLAWDNYKNH